MAPESHLDPRLLHLRILQLERDVPKQRAWCMECRAKMEKLLARISLENAQMLQQVAKHTSRVDELLAKATCPKGVR
jgi:multidrug resistance efflux pump